MPAPILDGQTLPLPSSHVREAEEVVDRRTLADGSTVRYHRGHRTRIRLGWRMRPAAAAALVDQLSRLRRVTQYVDIDGTPYVVEVQASDGVEAVPGTDPIRYAVGLTVVERRPR